MQFLRGSTLHLMQDLIPDLGSILTHRIVNYLSFYLSHSGQHLYYSPLLHSQSYLHAHFTRREQQHHQRGSNEHILAKMLLAAQFPEHVVDPKGTKRLMADLQALTHIDGKDIIECFLKVKCKDGLRYQPLQMATKPLPSEKRRNVYVQYQLPLPSHQQLTKIITQNPFYQLPNLNKVLVFANNPSQTLQLTTSLQAFCHQNGVKIKLFENASTQSLIEYIYNRSRGKILIHQNINFDKSIYNLKTPPSQQRKVNNKIINELYTRFMPQEVLLMTQRLPIQSLAKPQTKQIILGRMRDLMGLSDKDELIDPEKRIAMSTIEKNYRNEEQTMAQQTTLGFLLRRYVTEQVYAFNRKSDINTPFTNPSPFPQEK